MNTPVNPKDRGSESRPRFLLAVGVMLVGAGGLVFALATSPEVLPSEPVRMARTVLPRSTPAPVFVAQEGLAVAAVPPPEPSASSASSAEDGWPEPEREASAPQPNDPIVPELPQTPEWRHGKLVRITQLLDRDVERLAHERELARARGDEAEARRLDVQVLRHRARLTSLRAETEQIGRAVLQADASP